MHINLRNKPERCNLKNLLTLKGLMLPLMSISLLSRGYKFVAFSLFILLIPTNGFLPSLSLTWEFCTGFSLFLALMVDRLHHYIRELRMRRKSMEAVNKQNRGFEDGKNGASDDMKSLEEEASALRLKIKKLELCLEEKARETSDAEANSVALKKQSENFRLENDYLLEDNQNLRAQLQALDQRLSSDSKKD